jgi:hypothetical protein
MAMTPRERERRALADGRRLYRVLVRRVQAWVVENPSVETPVLILAAGLLFTELSGAASADASQKDRQRLTRALTRITEQETTRAQRRYARKGRR